MAVYTVFGQAAPGVTPASDTASYTMGMQFSLSQSATLTGIWWFSGTGATGLPTACCIYQITGTNTGSQVGGSVNTSPAWSGAAGTGWVKCTYTSGPVLSSGTNYRVCIQKDNTALVYSTTANYWSSGPGSGGITSGIITAPQSSLADGSNQDAFANGSAVLTYPAGSFNASNYWLDVEVTTSGGGPNVVQSNIPWSAGVSGWVMLPARGRAGSAA